MGGIVAVAIIVVCTAVLLWCMGDAVWSDYRLHHPAKQPEPDLVLDMEREHQDELREWDRVLDQHRFDHCPYAIWHPTRDLLEKPYLRESVPTQPQVQGPMQNVYGSMVQDQFNQKLLDAIHRQQRSYGP